MARRSKEQIKADNLRNWFALRGDWAYHGICTVCGRAGHVRGKLKRYVKCKECFVG